MVGVPGLGILILEVKGGRVVCEEGEWSSVSRDGRKHPLKRAPIAQARDAAFEIRRGIQERFGESSDAGRVVVGAVTAFPDSVAPPDQLAIERWEVLDHHDLAGHEISELIRNALAKTIERLSADSRRACASPAALRDVLGYLRPSFDGALPRAAHIKKQEEELLRLTNEQLEVLDELAENPRCLIKGAAGTGKTVLALEDARRSGWAGESTLLLCFNQPLAKSLSHTLSEEGVPNVQAGTFHSFLRGEILASEFASEFSAAEEALQRDKARLFNEVYPHFGQLAALGATDRFSRLVIDEGQDLLRPGFLATLDEWLIGGLKQGRWAMYGDFENQAIYSSGPAGFVDALRNLTEGASPARRRLTRNLRNSPIGLETAVLSGFDELPYRLSDDGGEALPVEYHYWRDEAEQVEWLEKELSKLLDSGVAEEDIVILSPRKWERSAASRIRGPRVKARALPWADEDTVGFSTIHRFKGMESPVVLLCDIETISAEGAPELLYVGMSRARSYLAVSISTAAQNEVREMLRAYLERSG